jgi:hypothetical protein
MTTDQAKILAIGIIAAVLVIGFVISLIISAIVGRIVVAIIAIGLALLVYSQRTEIKDSVRSCDVSFFGVHLTPSDPNVKQACQDQLNR